MSRLCLLLFWKGAEERKPHKLSFLAKKDLEQGALERTFWRRQAAWHWNGGSERWNRYETGWRKLKKAQVKDSWSTPGYHSSSSGNIGHSTASPGQEDKEPAVTTSCFIMSSSSDLQVSAPVVTCKKRDIVVKTVEHCLSNLALVLPQASSRAHRKQSIHTQSLTLSSSILVSWTCAPRLGTSQESWTLPTQPKSVWVRLWT